MARRILSDYYFVPTALLWEVVISFYRYFVPIGTYNVSCQKTKVKSNKIEQNVQHLKLRISLYKKKPGLFLQTGLFLVQ